LEIFELAKKSTRSSELREKNKKIKNKKGNAKTQKLKRQEAVWHH